MITEREVEKKERALFDDPLSMTLSMIMSIVNFVTELSFFSPFFFFNRGSFMKNREIVLFPFSLSRSISLSILSSRWILMMKKIIIFRCSLRSILFLDGIFYRLIREKEIDTWKTSSSLKLVVKQIDNNDGCSDVPVWMSFHVCLCLWCLSEC